MTRILLALFLGLASSLVLPALAQEQEKRLALVIGNGAYEAGALQTAANDAGLVAQTLQAAGFDVIGARDLDGETLRKSFRDFVQKVQEAGPNTVAFVYLAGYGVQLIGENYFVPVDARIVRDTDVPVEGIRLSDYMRQLSALQLKANVIVLDAARANPFAKEGQPLAGGLALVEPDAKMLVAFNAAPGTVAPEGAPPYGAYAQALAEMIRAGGLSLPEVFDRVRLRVSDMTKGGQLPWDAQKIDTSFVFFERQPDAPPVQLDASLRDKPIRDFDARDAYAAALERDTLQGYEDFLQAVPNDPLAERVRAIVAARREAIDWRRTYRTDTPPAYWSYLDRYPRGPHAADARRRLAILSAALEPPPSYGAIEYDVPPPPPGEIVYIDRPVLYFDDPVFAFAPPPPPPVYFLPPPEPEFVVLPPPPPPIGVFVLPVPVFVAIPVYCRPPAYVRPPPNNIIFANIHNRAVINNVINNRNPAPAQQLGGAARTGSQQVATPMPSVAPSLPPAAAQRANLVQPSPQPGGGQPGGQPGAPPGAPPGLGGKPAAPTTATPPPGAPANATAARTNPGTPGVPAPAAPGAHALPGANGQPLPKTATTPATATPPNAAIPQGAGAVAPSAPQPLNAKQTPAVQTTGVPPVGAKIQGGAPVAPTLSPAKPAENLKPAGTPPVAPANHPATTLAKPTSPTSITIVRPPPPPPPSAQTPAPAHATVSPAPVARTPPPPPPHIAAPPPRIAAPPPAPARVAAPPPPPTRVVSPPPMQVQRMAAPPPAPRPVAPPPRAGGAPCPPDKCRH